MSSVYQLRSSEDHSSLCSSRLLVYSPQLCLSGLEETDPWVWGLEYLSGGANTQRSMRWCECVHVCVCVFLSLLTSAPAIPVTWSQDPVVCKNIQYSLQSLQGWRKREQERERKRQTTTVRLCFHVSTAQLSKWCHSHLLLQYVTIPFLSPVSTHTLRPACWRRAIVSGTPSWSRSSIAVTPTSYKTWQLKCVFSIPPGYCLYYIVAWL